MAVGVSVGAAILLFAPAPAGGFEAPSFVGVAEGVNVMVGVGVSVATTTAWAWEASGVFDGTGVSEGSSTTGGSVAGGSVATGGSVAAAGSVAAGGSVASAPAAPGRLLPGAQAVRIRDRITATETNFKIVGNPFVFI